MLCLEVYWDQDRWDYNALPRLEIQR
jgi:hypothetical protein